jgi:hypothetical protein
MRQDMLELVKTDLRALEGQGVTINLRDGSCLRGYEVVSAPRSRVHTVWVSGQGVDLFVASDDIFTADGDRCTGVVRLDRRSSGGVMH